MKPVGYTVYLVTDAPGRYAHGLFANVEAALAGGVDVVQYRPTNETRRVQFETAWQLRDLLRAHHVPLVINDFVDLALAVNADGVHVGQADLPVEVVRRLIGPTKLLGLSITKAEQIDRLTADVDYIGVGPVFPTPTKPDAEPALGVEELARIAAHSHLPVVAIGGVNLGNAAAVYGAGVQGLAVVSAFSRASDPAGVARALRIASRAGRSARPRAGCP